MSFDLDKAIEDIVANGSDKYHNPVNAERGKEFLANHPVDTHGVKTEMTAQGVYKIYLNGFVGKTEFYTDDEEGISLQRVIKAVESIPEGAKAQIDMNSPGGSVMEGISIYKYIQNRKGLFTNIYIPSVCMSIATIISLALDKQPIMDKDAFYLVHNPMGGVYGNRKDMESMAMSLATTEKVMYNIYLRLEGMKLDREKLIVLLEQDRWLDFDEARKFGFVRGASRNDSVSASDDSEITSASNDNEALFIESTKLLGDAIISRNP